MFGTYSLEADLENEVATFCRDLLAGTNSVVVRQFGVDIAIFAPRQTRFIEVKAFTTFGCCGFGDRSGGTQLDLLWHKRRKSARTADELSVFDGQIRWLLCKKDMPPGTHRVSFFNCSQASAAAMGELRSGKQNNFRLSRLGWIDDAAMETELTLFIRSGA